MEKNIFRVFLQTELVWKYISKTAGVFFCAKNIHFIERPYKAIAIYEPPMNKEKEHNPSNDTQVWLVLTSKIF